MRPPPTVLASVLLLGSQTTLADEPLRLAAYAPEPDRVDLVQPQRARPAADGTRVSRATADLGSERQGLRQALQQLREQRADHPARVDPARDRHLERERRPLREERRDRKLR